MGKMINLGHPLHSASASITAQRLILLLKENWIPAFAGMTRNKIRIKHVIPRPDRGIQWSFKGCIKIKRGFYGLV
jgi:hypothetical protein